jgi:uncharacterized membrane protein
LESILIMIVIGIVSVLFRRSKNKQGQHKNKPFSRTTFEEIRTQVKKQLSYVEDKKTGTHKPEHKTNVILKNLDNNENKYLHYKQESEVNRNGITILVDKNDKIKGNIVKEDEGMFSLHPDEKAIINGIIWSEILGEPRSKKPYRPRNR